IGYIGEIPELGDYKVINEHRFRAFKNTLAKHNISLDENYIKNITLSSKEGYNAMTEIIKGGNLPSAIFCGNDITAIGVMKAIHKSGLKIPKDISVIGLDNIEVSEYFRPSLTTVHVPKEELGRFAVKLLIDRINGGHEINTLIKLPFKLIERESCDISRNL
ncbi:MAG TPA: substrate-binding domain-containing protein, partial [Tepidanaerobacteraceae bacterium]|nr:substrate-binding domain-containing protein [Tepidanaerobacteraceae bacterium]